ncbi:S-adenosyl-L-methionine-dependent methyltransferase [Cladochytrium replicatum]|nr:S-adenosyl-L-methionine-dependent methyltransferase [Cladochytrium replicatum]
MLSTRWKAVLVVAAVILFLNFGVFVTNPNVALNPPSSSLITYSEPTDSFGVLYEQQQALFCRLAKYNQIVALRPELRNSGGSSTASSVSPIDYVPITKAASPFNMFLYQAKSDVVSRNIAERGEWEMTGVHAIRDKLALVAQVTGQKNAFLDIGANVGWFTFNMAAAGYPVLAFEPMSQNEVLLRTTMCGNPELMSRIAYYPLGLGKKESMCYIVSHIENVGDGFTVCDVGPDYKPKDDYPIRGEFNTKLLSKVLAPYTKCEPGSSVSAKWSTSQYGLHGTPPIGVLKIDVEGFEPNVIAGGLDFFRCAKIPYVRSEIGMTGHDDAVKYLKMWVDLGYELRVGDDLWGGPVLMPQDIRKYVNTLEALADVHMIHKDWFEIAEKTGRSERQTRVWS